MVLNPEGLKGGITADEVLAEASGDIRKVTILYLLTCDSFLLNKGLRLVHQEHRER